MASDRPAASASIVPITRKLATGEDVSALEPNPRTLEDVRILAMPQGEWTV